MINIACVQEVDPFTCCTHDSFIHGIINAVIWFGNPERDSITIFFDNLNSPVCTSPVNQNIFNIRICLIQNRLDGSFYYCFCIIANSHYRNFHRFIHTVADILHTILMQTSPKRNQLTSGFAFL